MIDLSIGLGRARYWPSWPLMPITISSAGAPLWTVSTALGSRWRIPGRATRLPSCSSRLIAADGPPGRLPQRRWQRAAKRPLPCWMSKAWPALASTISRMPWLACSSALPTHPSFETFVSACGRVSGKLKHTLLACLAPPTVRTKARFMNVHRLFTWAERLLSSRPPAGQDGLDLSQVARLPGSIARVQRPHQALSADALGLLACQKILKTNGALPRHPAQCEPLIDAMP